MAAPEFRFGSFLRPPGASPVRIKALPLHSLAYYGVPRRKLGAGSYGGVAAYCTVPCVREVAVKFATSESDGAIDPGLLHEVVALIRTDHPNVVGIVDVVLYDHGTRFAMVLPVASTSLADYGAIDHGGNPALILTDESILNITYQLARALLYLESVDVWHRDLKPGNILLYDDSCTTDARRKVYRVVITDFGASRVGMCAYIAEMTHSDVTTYVYAAPELLLGGRYTAASEIWTLGCIVYELQTREVAFQGYTIDGVASRILSIMGTPTRTQWPALRVLPRWKAEYDRPITTGEREDPFGRDSPVTRLLRRTLAVSPSTRATTRELVYGSEMRQYREGVERCLPAPDPYAVGCEVRTEEEASLVGVPVRPLWMTLETRLHLVQRLEEFMASVPGGTFRALFMALAIVDSYLGSGVGYGSGGGAVTEQVLAVAVHLSRNLVDETRPVRAVELVGKDHLAAFASLELRVLTSLRFSVHLTTSLDVLEACISSALYSQPTYDATLLLLRAGCRGTLVYNATQQEITALCLAMACSVTGDAFRHASLLAADRTLTLIGLFFSDVKYLLGQARTVDLRSPSDTLEGLLRKMVLSRAFIQ
jgi:serine/threonine protein kinase